MVTSGREKAEVLLRTPEVAAVRLSMEELLPAYQSLRHPGGACAAVFEPNTVRACRHETYLTFRWNGRDVTQIYEKRILELKA